MRELEIRPFLSILERVETHPTSWRLDVMKLTLALILGLALLTGCNGNSDDAAVANANLATQSDDTHSAADHAATTPAANDNLMRGKVLETMNSGGYTYARIQGDDGEFWAAAPATELTVGVDVEMQPNMLMPDFESKTLGRTFDEIWFVSSYMKPGELPADEVQQELSRAHSGVSTGDPLGDPISVQPAAGGITVADIHALGDGANGHDVLLRGKVVKANFGILGTNWYHIQDGTGEAGTNDLTITSSAKVSVGDVVLVTGKLATDRDFGAGYTYKLIVEDAEVVADAM
jgi:hypothetical protein